MNTDQNVNIIQATEFTKHPPSMLVNMTDATSWLITALALL